MRIRADIIKTELEFPKCFANYQDEDYGILFYNDENKTSYDSNHAILYEDKIHDFNVVLNKITDFYLGKGIEPRIYLPYDNSFFENNKHVFEECGYRIFDYEKICFYQLLEENHISGRNRLTIERVTEWDERISLDILLPNDSGYSIEVIKESLKDENYHFFVGYLGNVAVTTASIYYSEYGCARLDDVQTAISYRNNGYSREIISYIVEYHKRFSDSVLYQWPANETAEKIYIEAGFRPIFEVEQRSVIFNKKTNGR